jgi:hypothetical protein
LLARSRSGEQGSVPAPAPKTIKPKPTSEPTAPPSGTFDLPPTSEIVQELQDFAERKKADPNRVRLNKDEMREDIKSFRELANISARTAVAKHSWKKLRGELFAKALITAAAFGVSGALYTGVFGERFHNPIYAGVAATIGGFLGWEFLKSAKTLMRLNTKKGTKSKSKKVSTPPEEAADSEGNKTV